MSTGEIIGTILLVALILACIPGVIVTSIGRKRTRIEDEEGDEEDIYAYLESYVEETPEPAENPEPEQNPEPESEAESDNDAESAFVSLENAESGKDTELEEK